MIYSIFGAIFFAASLSKVVTGYLIEKFQLNFFSSDFSSQIPSFSEELGIAKTYDIADFSIFAIVAIGIFLINLTTTKILKKRNRFGLAYLIINSLIFLQVYFVDHSRLFTVILLLIVQTLYTLSFFSNLEKRRKFSVKSVGNGIFLGFYLLILLNSFTASIALTLGIFILTPVIFAILDADEKKFTLNQSFSLLLLSAFYPFNLSALYIIGTLSLITLILFRKKKIKLNRLYAMYPYLILFVFVYNPTFYLGTFDSVEEGFWLGWLQRLINGEVIYRDFYSYHPPFITWGLSFFSKIFGHSMYNLRLYLHILQVVGILLVFLILDKLVSGRALKIIIVILILGFSATGVRNNVEIRLGLGLLSVFYSYKFIQSRKLINIFLSGMMVAISLMSSIEIGLAALISIILLIIIFEFKKGVFKPLTLFTSGFLFIVLPIIFYLYSTDALSPFISQITFYLNAFSNGYLNSSIERTDTLTLLQWHVVNRYLSSPAWFWEIARFSLLGIVMLLIYKFVYRKTGKKDKLVIALLFYTAILFRSALGRSDIYHMLLVIIPSLMFLGYLVEQFTERKKYLDLFVFLVIALFFARGATQLGFLQPQLIKFQKYGNPAGNYPSYQTSRTGILTGIEVDTETYDNMISYIHSNTTKDETIFIYPWMPEIYFLADRKNATSFDTPLAFFTDEHQKKMISELQENEPSFVVYNPDKRVANLGVGSLPKVQEYLEGNYQEVTKFGSNKILKR